MRIGGPGADGPRHIHPGLWIAGAVLWLAVLALPARATQTFPGVPSLTELARRADVVVLGEVTSTAGAWDASHANIHTRVSLAVAERLKGLTPSSLVFTHLGGRVGGESSIVGGALEFQPGERVLVFLTSRPDGSLTLTNLFHGAFSIERDSATGREYAVRATGGGHGDRIELHQVRADIQRALGG